MCVNILCSVLYRLYVTCYRDEEEPLVRQRQEGKGGLHVFVFFFVGSKGRYSLPLTFFPLWILLAEDIKK